MFALVDCNNFFASCERVFDPSLRNKPVAVLSNNDGCIVTRTPEVKALGIPMAAPYFKYKDILEKHNVAVFSSNFTLYGDMSDRVMQTISQFSPDIEYYSIDEAFLDLSGFKTRDLQKYGEKIRDTVYKWTGIPVAVGIAETKTLAKIACEYVKAYARRDGVLDLSKKTEKEINTILGKMPVGDVWGIGYRSTKMLNSFQVNTALDFKNQKESWVKMKMHSPGLDTLKELKGEVRFKLGQSKQSRKSILSSRSFGRRVTDIKELEEAVATYVGIAARKLREQKSVASTITVFIKTGKHQKTGKYSNAKTIAFAEPTAHTSKMIQKAKEALTAIYKQGYRYKKAGVYLGGIQKESTMQKTLFQKDFYSKKERRLMKAMDQINNSHGGNTIHSAAEGTKKQWKMKSNLRSGRYTTNWDELKMV